MQKIEIKSKNEDGCAFVEIFVDGKKLENVRSYELTHGSGIPVLKLELNALRLAVDTEALIIDRNLLREMEIVWKE